MRGLAGLVAAVLLASGAPPLVTAQGAFRTIDVAGLRRTYALRVPASLNRERPAALVFVLHGGGGTAAATERLTGFSRLADTEGFVVVFPEAVDRNWNDWRDAPGIRAQRDNVDDVGFVAAVLRRVSAELRIDPNRVYATGISNGGFMSQLLAAQLSDRFAAIAPVASGMAPRVADNFRPKEPVSVLIMNGTEDPLVPYNGGPVALNRGRTIATAEIVRKWVAHNRCGEKPEVSYVPDRDPADGTRVKREIYSGCARDVTVALYTIEGGGHTWPGGQQYLPEAIIGRTSRDLDATRTIWGFFSAHPRR